MRQRRWLGSLALAVCATISLRTSPAGASMTGPCTATVNGHDVASLSASSPSDAIDVKESDTVAVKAQSSSAIGEYRVQLEYAGIHWTVAKGQATDNGWSREVKVSTYARYGSGLYRVHGVSGGSSACDGAVLINVDGQPLTTPLGLGAVAFILVGAANLAATVRRARKVVAS